MPKDLSGHGYDAEWRFGGCHLAESKPLPCERLSRNQSIRAKRLWRVG
jgi:hypothetical protein